MESKKIRLPLNSVPNASATFNGQPSSQLYDAVNEMAKKAYDFEPSQSVSVEEAAEKEINKNLSQLYNNWDERRSGYTKGFKDALIWQVSQTTESDKLLSEAVELIKFAMKNLKSEQFDFNLIFGKFESFLTKTATIK